MFRKSLTGIGYSPAPSRRVRVTAVLASLAYVALILLLLIKMGIVAVPAGQMAPHLASVIEQTQDSAGNHPHPKVVKQPAMAARHIETPRLPPTAPHPAAPAPSFIHLSREEFAAADIGKMAKPEAASGDAGDSQGAGAYGPGEGPGGARLYRAEWYRRPSDAEIDGYIKNAAPSGAWADIACRTADHFHVEDCEELGESPAGSGLSRALRQAAWQFLVRPPRVNGTPQIGVWVKIHFDFIVRNAPDVDLPPRP